MKQKSLLLFITASLLPLLFLTACPYDRTVSPSDNAAAAWNSPATQQEVTLLTQIGVNALNAWLSGQVKGRHVSKETFIEQRVKVESEAHPGLTKAKIRKAIREKLKNAPG